MEPPSPHSRQGAGARESPRAMESGGFDRERRKIEGGCEPWPDQPGRSDPKHRIWIPTLSVKACGFSQAIDTWDPK